MNDVRRNFFHPTHRSHDFGYDTPLGVDIFVGLFLIDRFAEMMVQIFLEEGIFAFIHHLL